MSLFAVAPPLRDDPEAMPDVSSPADLEPDPPDAATRTSRKRKGTSGKKNAKKNKKEKSKCS